VSALDPIAEAALRELTRQEMSISELARKVALHRSDLGRWLAGSRSLRVRDAVKVMGVLGLVVVHRRELDGKAQARGRDDRHLRP
jgi:DNA-binding phage protein